jgi:hypothetical protein
MSWALIRDVGFIMFICGSLMLFAVTLGRYLDPPPSDASIRIICDSWMWFVGDGLMLVSAFVAVMAIVSGYLVSI